MLPAAAPFACLCVPTRLLLRGRPAPPTQRAKGRVRAKGGREKRCRAVAAGKDAQQGDDFADQGS